MVIKHLTKSENNRNFQELNQNTKEKDMRLIIELRVQ